MCRALTFALPSHRRPGKLSPLTSPVTGGSEIISLDDGKDESNLAGGNTELRKTRTERERDTASQGPGSETGGEVESSAGSETDK